MCQWLMHKYQAIIFASCIKWCACLLWTGYWTSLLVQIQNDAHSFSKVGNDSVFHSTWVGLLIKPGNGKTRKEVGLDPGGFFFFFFRNSEQIFPNPYSDSEWSTSIWLCGCLIICTSSRNQKCTIRLSTANNLWQF